MTHEFLNWNLKWVFDMWIGIAKGFLISGGIGYCLDVNEILCMIFST